MDSAGNDISNIAAGIIVAVPSESVADISENGSGTSKKLETDSA